MKQLDLKDYTKRYSGKLLGSNRKLKKSAMMTKGLSLLPHRLAGGFNLCPSSTEGCRTTCIVYSGNARFKGTNEGRYQRSRFFLEHKETFLDFLKFELSYFRGAVRLNTFSDIPWEKYIDMEDFEWVQFYDYTKIVDRYDRFLARKNMAKNDKSHLLRALVPNNYHLTFSYSGENGADCLEFLESKGTVSVVFKGSVPETFAGYPVINGDESDERWKDPEGHVIGLKYKTNTVHKDANQVALNTFVVKEGETMFITKRQ